LIKAVDVVHAGAGGKAVQFPKMTNNVIKDSFDAVIAYNVDTAKKAGSRIAHCTCLRPLEVERCDQGPAACKQIGRSRSDAAPRAGNGNNFTFETIGHRAFSFLS
jgi:hypothetical protein